MPAREKEETGSASYSEASQRIPGFFRVGGSIFYSLSALSIIWGLSKVLGPIFKSNSLWEKVLCIGALNLYELALLGMLVLLTVWKKVYDDAVALVIISALFYISGGIIIDTIASDSISFSGIIGTAALIFALFRLFVLKRTVKMKISVTLFSGLTAICAWNYLTSTFMSKVHQHLSESPEITWRYGWALMLSGMLLILLNVIRTPSRRGNVELTAGDKTPFLASNVMAWMFSAEIIVLSCLHQYILSYIYDLQISFGDFIPASTIFIFFIAESIRCTNIRKKNISLLLAFMPLMLIIIGKFSSSLTIAEGAASFIWNPGFTGIISLIWSISYALRTQNRNFIYPAATYAIFLLLFGFSSADTSISLHNANWHAFAVATLFTLLIAGILLRESVLIYIAVIAGTVGIAVNPSVELFCLTHSISQTGFGLLSVGTGILALYPFINEDISDTIPHLGSLIFAAGIITVSAASPSPAVLTVTAAFSCTAALCWHFALQNLKAIPVIICSPLLYHTALLCNHMQGWHYVLLGFMLLTLGGAVSVIKTGKKSAANS